MNERIKELARQAGMEYHSEHQYDAFDEEKFAELIVRECADYVDSAISDGGVDGRVVKEHFGVSE